MLKNSPAEQASVLGHVQVQVELLRTYGYVHVGLFVGHEQPPDEFETNGDVHTSYETQSHVVELRIYESVHVGLLSGQAHAHNALFKTSGGVHYNVHAPH